MLDAARPGYLPGAELLGGIVARGGRNIATSACTYCGCIYMAVLTVAVFIWLYLLWLYLLWLYYEAGACAMLEYT